MQYPIVAAILAFVGFAAAAPAPGQDNYDCETVWVTSTVTSTSTCPIVSLPLSPIVTGTLVPVGSIVNGLTPRAAEPTVVLAAPAAVEARNEAWAAPTVTSTTTVTVTVKPTCQIANPGSA